MKSITIYLMMEADYPSYRASALACRVARACVRGTRMLSTCMYQTRHAEPHLMFMPGAQVGAAAFMGGATRMTLTTTVMVMETTGALQLIVPLMLTVFVAKVREALRFQGECCVCRPWDRAHQDSGSCTCVSQGFCIHARF